MRSEKRNAPQPASKRARNAKSDNSVPKPYENFSFAEGAVLMLAFAIMFTIITLSEAGVI